MVKSKVLTMTLIDGTLNGRIKISSRSDIAFKIPRDKVENLRNNTDIEKELTNSGIYFLFGENEIYIGQALNVNNRLLQHKKQKNYWIEAVVFTTSDNSLGSTEISFLENKFCNLAIDAKRYEVKNCLEPSQGNISSEKKIALITFTEYVELVMQIFGYKVFEPADEKIKPVEKIEPPPAPKIQSPENTESHIFYVNRNADKKYGECHGKCIKISDKKFIVLAGSQLSPSLSGNGIGQNVIDARKNAKISKDLILLNDVEFDNPSAAAEFVNGVSTNGWRLWKTADGVTLSKFSNREK